MGAVRFPFGTADIQNPAHATALGVTIDDAGMTFVNVAANATGTAITMNVTNGKPPVDGARLVVRFSSGAAARNFVCGTNMLGPGLTGVINKSQVAEFVWQTSAWVQTSAIQLD